MSTKLILPGITLSELQDYLAAAGEKSFRARQICQWLYEQNQFDAMQMLNLPLQLREKLVQASQAPRSRVVDRQSGSGGTVKLLLELHDKEIIEMVLIPSPERMTFCLSTQVGCPVRCRFCASGAHGLVRNLSSDEILEELYWGCVEHGSKPDNKNAWAKAIKSMGEVVENVSGVLGL